MTAAPALSNLLELEDGQFVQCAYLTLLGRPADNVGLTHFLARLRADVPKLNILEELLNSPEAAGRPTELPGLRAAIKEAREALIRPTAAAAQTIVPKAAADIDGLLAMADSAFVECAYQTLLKRPPDPGGLKYYMEQMRTGIAKIEILDQMLESPEARLTNVDLPGLQDAVRPFRLARLPMIGPLVKLFGVAGPMGNTSMLARLLAKHNGEFVLSAYRVILNRPPDPDGFSHYLARLHEGMAKIAILENISTSPEAKAKGIEVPGLARAIRLYRIARVPFLGALVRQLPAVEGNTGLERVLHHTEQRRHLIDTRTIDVLAIIEQRLDAIESAQRHARELLLRIEQQQALFERNSMDALPQQAERCAALESRPQAPQAGAVAAAPDRPAAEATLHRLKSSLRDTN